MKKLREAVAAVRQQLATQLVQLTEVGRTLNKDNEGLIRSAIEQLNTVLKALDAEALKPTAAGLKLVEGYSAAASRGASATNLMTSLLYLMSDEEGNEGDSAEDIAKLQQAFTLINEYVTATVGEIGSSADGDTSVADMGLGDLFASLRGPRTWAATEAARLALLRGKAREAGIPGYVPEAYTADADETVECPTCGLMNSPDARFCDQCGSDLLPDNAEARRQVRVHELVQLTEKSVRRDGTVPLKVIQPGWGSSGYYSAEMLERDGPKVFGKGTKMFWDHPTAMEEQQRPERSLRDLAAEFVSDARYQQSGPEGPGLYADAKVFGPYTEAVEELAPHMGVSIRASGKGSQGVAEGRQGRIIEELVSAASVDFVTQPGAGGRVLSLFEAARGRNRPEEGDDVELQEALRQLKEAQDARAAAEQRATRAEEQITLREAADFVVVELREQKLPDIVKARLVRTLAGALPVKEGKVDKEAAKAKVAEAVKEEIDYFAKATGAGSVSGFGGGGGGGDERKPEAILEMAFSDMGLSESTAKLAAAGRG